MRADYIGIVVAIGIVVVFLIGKGGVRWVGRYLVYVSGKMFKHQWHGFPIVHRIERMTWTRERVTDEVIEIFGCGGICGGNIRKKSKLICCNVCGKTISEDPIGDFVQTSRGELRVVT